VLAIRYNGKNVKSPRGEWQRAPVIERTSKRPERAAPEAATMAAATAMGDDLVCGVVGMGEERRGGGKEGWGKEGDSRGHLLRCRR
jgi:hypothetical protein